MMLKKRVKNLIKEMFAWAITLFVLTVVLYGAAYVTGLFLQFLVG